MASHIDMYLSTGLYVWLRLEEGENAEDLSLVTINDSNNDSPYNSSNDKHHDNSIGTMPDALKYEICQSDWNGILNVPHMTEESGLGWVFVTSCTEWALRHGIAPYQTFCIRMDGAPEYTSYSCDDWDVTFASWEIVEKERLSNFEIQRRWDHWFMMRARYRERAKVGMLRLNYLRENDLNAMYLTFSNYWSKGYADAVYPDGICIRLCSKHVHVENCYKSAWCELLNGRDDEGRYEVALERLIDKARTQLPHLTPAFIKALSLK